VLKCFLCRYFHVYQKAPSAWVASDKRDETVDKGRESADKRDRTVDKRVPTAEKGARTADKRARTAEKGAELRIKESEPRITA